MTLIDGKQGPFSRDSPPTNRESVCTNLEIGSKLFSSNICQALTYVIAVPTSLTKKIKIKNYQEEWVYTVEGK